MIKSRFLPVIFISLITCLIFFKIFIKGFYPIPGDLLVSFYFPWYSGGWEGYNPWTTHKELLNADSIRQIYLWKEFAANQLKEKKPPLWNPYTFSGQPLAANFQSGVYYPLNIFYFIFGAKTAWIILVTIQPLLAGIFMYLASRSCKIKRIPSLFASIAFMFSSYLITWMENNNVGHSYIWLPLTFWSINRFFQNFKFRYLLTLVIALSFSTLAGHPQTTLYIYMFVILFWLYKLLGQGRKYFKNATSLLLVLITAIATTSIQIIPTAQFYKNSPISLPFSKAVFDRGVMPPENLITFFASDFFGNPATNNFWNFSYGDFTPYLGVIPLIFALWAIKELWKNKLVRFLTLISLVFIASSIHGPITFMIKTLQIPFLDSTTPSRFISISIFLLIILAAFGLEDFLKKFQDKKYLKKFIYFLLPIGTVYLLMWTFAVFGTQFLEPKETWQINLAVTRRNLILPTLMFLSIPIGTLMIQIIRVKIKAVNLWAKALVVIGVFTVTLVGGVYFSNKFLPVAPKKFIFPDHLLFNWLQTNAGIYRFYGGGTAHIDFNFPTHYKVYGIEGYDTLRLKRYAELLAASFNGKVPDSYLRSDGVVPNEENGYRRRLFDLLGVKFLLDKEDDPKTGADWHYERFRGDQVAGLWQSGKFQVYERKSTLPRFFLTTKYTIIKDDDKVISTIYDSSFNLNRLILEEKPPIEVKELDQNISIPDLEKYSPGEILIKTNASNNSLLFLSDVYDPDWRVYIDGGKSQLLRAHYALVSVAVPKGEHVISFKYEPKSFRIGFAISLISTLGLVITSIIFKRMGKF